MAGPTRLFPAFYMSSSIVELDCRSRRFLASGFPFQETFQSGKPLGLNSRLRRAMMAHD